MQAPIKKRAIHRLKILQGLLGKMEILIENDEYCMDILNQSLAIQEAMKSLDALVLESHLKTCVRSQMKSDKTYEKAVKELLKIYKLNRK